MTKTISLADDAYEAFSAVKREGESFSLLARRAARRLALDELLDPQGEPVFDADEAGALQKKIRGWRDDPRNERA